MKRFKGIVVVGEIAIGVILFLMLSLVVETCLPNSWLQEKATGTEALFRFVNVLKCTEAILGGCVLAGAIVFLGIFVFQGKKLVKIISVSSSKTQHPKKSPHHSARNDIPRYAQVHQHTHELKKEKVESQAHKVIDCDVVPAQKQQDDFVSYILGMIIQK